MGGFQVKRFSFNAALFLAADLTSVRFILGPVYIERTCTTSSIWHDLKLSIIQEAEKFYLEPGNTNNQAQNYIIKSERKQVISCINVERNKRNVYYLLKTKRDAQRTFTALTTFNNTSTKPII